ncbi:MAG: glycerate kinase [Halanaeroarchaeum sp.]
MTEIEDRAALVAGSDRRDLALSCIEAGIAAARPDRIVRESITLEGDRLEVAGETVDLGEYRRVVVLGGGNAAAYVADALESVLGDRLDGGVVVTDDPVETETVDVLPADHPIPSTRGVASTRRLLDAAAEADSDTLVLGVITGGGSATMAAPAGDVTLADLQATTRALLRSGASIHEINAVRKHCSSIKGGHLAAALAPARTVSLVFSDVVGNDLDVIASGPLVPDGSTFDEAHEVLARHDVDVPESVRDRLEAGAAGDVAETPSAGNRIFDPVSTHVLADGYTALEAAADAARRRGHEPIVLSSRFEGDPATLGETHAAIAAEATATGSPVAPPAVLLSGGETTVAHAGDGRGGPNQEFVLGAALATDVPATVAAVDTDGVDGTADAAGAILDADGDVDAPAGDRALESHDVAPYLAGQDATIETGPTGTNVNDLRVVVLPA